MHVQKAFRACSLPSRFFFFYIVKTFIGSVQGLPCICRSSAFLDAVPIDSLCLSVTASQITFWSIWYSHIKNVYYHCPSGHHKGHKWLINLWSFFLFVFYGKTLYLYLTSLVPSIYMIHLYNELSKKFSSFESTHLKKNRETHGIDFS